MPTNNFIQFNSNKENMMNDDTYSSKAPQGIVGGGTVANSTLHNKLFYQLSTMVSSISKTVTDNGLDISDSDINTLTNTLKNSFKKSVYSAMSINTDTKPYELKDLSIKIVPPNLNNDNYITGSSNGYIVFGNTYANFTFQFGNTYVDTEITGPVPGTIITREVVYPLAFKEVWNINLCLQDSALSTNNLERIIYFIRTDHNQDPSNTRFFIANHSEYKSGYNTYIWQAYGII